MRTRIGWFSLLCTLLALACGGDGGSDELDGRAFLLDSSEGFTPVSGTTVRLSFMDGSLSLSAGCNSMGGSYTLRDGHLKVTELSSTKIGCDPDRHAQDSWLGDLLLGEPRLTLEKNTLTLKGSDAVLVFLDREVKDPDRPLAGAAWTIDTFIERDAASNDPMAMPLTVEFGDDGELTVELACNRGVGHYTVSGKEITLRDVAYTEKACGAAGALDAKVQTVLSAGVLTFEIEAARLTLMRGSVGLSAIRE